MADKINLTIVTPEREVITTEVDEITAPGWDGEFGVLPDHVPFLSLLKSGELNYRLGDEHSSIAVGFGFIEVLPSKVTVLIETAETVEEIDLDRAMRARDRALERLSGHETDINYEMARISLMRAISRIKVAQQHKGIAQRSTEAQFKR